MTKFQAILKNGKNGSKLFNTPNQAIAMYPNGQIEKLVTIDTSSFESVKTGNRNKKGRQFLGRSL